MGLSPAEKAWKTRNANKKSKGKRTPKQRAFQRAFHPKKSGLTPAQKAFKTMNSNMVKGFRKPAKRTWDFPSKSSPGKFYTVRENADGSLSCNCKPWIFNQRKAKTLKGRSCGHTDKVKR